LDIGAPVRSATRKAIRSQIEIGNPVVIQVNRNPSNDRLVCGREDDFGFGPWSKREKSYAGRAGSQRIHL
jgi:hypothetical protein